MNPNYGSFTGWDGSFPLFPQQQQQQCASQAQSQADQIQQIQQAAQQQQQAAILALAYDIQLAAAAQQIRQAIQIQQAAQLQHAANIQLPQQDVQPKTGGESAGMPQSHLDSLLLASGIAQQEQQLFDKLSTSDSPSGALSAHLLEIQQRQAQELELQKLLQQNQRLHQSDPAAAAFTPVVGAQQEQAAHSKMSQQHASPQQISYQQQRSAFHAVPSVRENKTCFQTSSTKELSEAHATLSFPPGVKFVNPFPNQATSPIDCTKESTKTIDQSKKNIGSMVHPSLTRMTHVEHKPKVSKKWERAPKSTKALPEIRNTLSHPSSVVSHPVSSLSVVANAHPPTPTSSGGKVHHGKEGSEPLASSQWEDRKKSLLEERKRRWSTLLVKRPTTDDSNAMSAWLVEVLAVSDFEKTTPGAPPVSSPFFSSGGSRKRQKFVSSKNDNRRQAS